MQGSRALQCCTPLAELHRSTRRAPELSPRMAPPVSPQPDLAGAALLSRPFVEPLSPAVVKAGHQSGQRPCGRSPLAPQGTGEQYPRPLPQCIHVSAPCRPQPVSTHHRAGGPQQAAIGLRVSQGRPARQSRGQPAPIPGATEAADHGSRGGPQSDPTADLALREESPALSRRQRHN
ncbi:hypothetical protein NDU88_002491 [Pleurodeles waltl]|uniref:Uncharacterized protein n=1 Tax=Pleurodeles waltl TaxID=8319 RepID=A0AAV7UX80_PLEWA|nr:hypothetical protein NDU88_002491 [Pleurodeles waltl]